MDAQVSQIAIAGLGFTVFTAEPAWRELIAARLSLHRGPLPPLCQTELIADQGLPPARGLDYQVLQDTRAIELRGASLHARHDLGTGRCHMRVAAAYRREPELLWNPLANALRILAALLLPRHGGGMFHGAGLVDPASGRAFLLLGPSGRGKTTAARNASGLGAVVASDDLVPVTWGPETAPRLWGSPFWGDWRPERPFQGAAPLAGIAQLVQAPRVKIEPLDRASTVATLAAMSPYVGSVMGQGTLLARLEVLSQGAQGWRLELPSDASFWPALLIRNEPICAPGSRRARGERKAR